MNHLTLLLSTLVIVVSAAMIIGLVSRGTHVTAAAPRFMAKLRGAARSKTIWLNGIGFMIVQQLPDAMPDLMNQFPTLQPYLPANIFQTLTVCMVVLNMMLRFHTRMPLEAK